MDSPPSSTTTWLLHALISIALTTLITYISTKKTKTLKLPPSPKPSLIPFIGHLHLLKFPLHRTYHKLSQNLGPIMSLRLGTRLAVVVSSPTLVEECFTKNDVALANRVHLMIGKYLGYNHTTLSGSNYGDHWRNLRRIATVEMLSTTRLNMFRSIRQDEVMLLLRKLKNATTASNEDYARVELRHAFSGMTFNVVMRMIAGRRYFDEDSEEGLRFHDLIEEVFSIGGVSNPADFLPLMRLVDFKGIEKNMKRVSSKMDAFLQSLIDEHRGNRKNSNNSNTTIDHLLSLQESHPTEYTDEIIKGLLLVMILAGTDTSAVTMEWAMSALLNHPEKIQKARSEIDAVVGPRRRLISEEDLPELPYLQSIVWETLRLYPAAPLLLPHEAAEDCKIGGYDVPRGAILMVNAWAMHRDPTAWEEPESFRPERFAVEGEARKILSFGMGRRSCPGQGLANRVVGLTIGSLVQCFDWRRVGEELVDMREGKGVSMPKVVPLEAMCKARDVIRNLAC